MKIDCLGWEQLEPYLHHAGGQGITSLRDNKSRFRYLKEWFQEKELNAINFSIFLQEAENKGLSTSYQDNYLKLVKHISRYFKEEREFETFKYKFSPTPPENILSPQQIVQLAETRIKYILFKNRRIKHKVLINLLGNVGSRIDETLKLEWTDIKVEDIILIHFRREITKTKKERYCPIPVWLYKMLASLPRENQFIFSKIHANNFREDLEKRRQKCNIPFKVTCHTFRDSSINNKLTFGMPFEEVATYHGHLKLDTTYRSYTKIKAKKLAISLRTFDPAFKDELTYENCTTTAVDNAEKVINPNVCEYQYETYINETGKRVKIVRMIEK